MAPHVTSQSRHVPTSHQPRVWTALIAFPIAFAFFVVVNIGVMVTFALLNTLPEGKAPSPEDMLAVIQDPTSLLIVLALSQLTLLAVALAGGILSPRPLRQRLALHKPRVPWWSLLIMMLGTPALAWAVIVLYGALGVTPSDHMADLAGMGQAVEGYQALLLIAVIGFFPGVCEEFLMRGYIQTRLVARWGAMVGIFIASVFFAVMHMDPQHMGIAFALGIWCGVVAWRTGSLWSAVLCHTFNNLLAATLGVLDDGEAMETYQLADLSLADWSIFAVIGVCFLIAVLLLWKGPRSNPVSSA